MMGHKTLSEIRAELRSQGIDTERLREELTQLFEQPRRDKQSARILSDLTKSLKIEAAKKTRKRRTATSKGSR
jgi:hypothetical protein